MATVGQNSPALGNNNVLVSSSKLGLGQSEAKHLYRTDNTFRIFSMEAHFNRVKCVRGAFVASIVWCHPYRQTNHSAQMPTQ